mgnify:CR=1 FL=1
MKTIKNKVGFKNIAFIKVEKASKKERKNKTKHRVEITSE